MRTTASVGSTILGVSQSSKRMSRGSYRTAPFIANLLQPTSSAILLVADLFHPVDVLSVLSFLDGDVRHRVRRRRSMPMLQTRRKPHDIAGADFFDRAALAL